MANLSDQMEAFLSDPEETRGRTSDSICPPSPIKISSNMKNGCPIIIVEPGRTDKRNFQYETVDERGFNEEDCPKYQLTTSVSTVHAPL